MSSGRSTDPVTRALSFRFLVAGMIGAAACGALLTTIATRFFTVTPRIILIAVAVACGLTVLSMVMFAAHGITEHRRQAAMYSDSKAQNHPGGQSGFDGS